MKWWKLALVVSVLWILATAGAWAAHVWVISAQVLTSAQRMALLQFYGMGTAVGVVFTWIFYFARSRGERPTTKHPATHRPD